MSDRSTNRTTTLDHEHVTFAVDIHQAGTSDNLPVGSWSDISGTLVPLLGQIWLDSSYRLPIPVPHHDDKARSAPLSRSGRRPSATTALILDK